MRLDFNASNELKRLNRNDIEDFKQGLFVCRARPVR